MKQLASHFGLLEAARWYPDYGLVFSDMIEGGVYRQASVSDTPEVVFPHRKAIGGLVRHGGGGFVLAGRNVAHKSVGEESETSVLLTTNEREQFFNDLTADGLGRIFVGSVGKEVDGGSRRQPGSLYRIDLQGQVTLLADDVLMTNGLGTDSLDQYLYHVDSDRRLVFRYGIGADAAAISRDVFVDTNGYDGRPDGLAVGTDGSVWVAMAGGALVVGWDADGHVLEEVAVPHDLVTSVCFGGSDYRTMFILTGQNHEHPDPDGGCIYMRESGYSGSPSGVARVQLPGE